MCFPFQKEQERQNELQRQIELNVRADEHYRKALMKFWVLVPLKKMVEMAQEKMKVAEHHHNLCMMRYLRTVLRVSSHVWHPHTNVHLPSHSFPHVCMHTHRVFPFSPKIPKKKLVLIYCIALFIYSHICFKIACLKVMWCLEWDYANITPNGQLIEGSCRVKAILALTDLEYLLTG